MSILDPTAPDTPFPFPTRKSKPEPPKQHDIVPPADEQQEQQSPFKPRQPQNETLKLHYYSPAIAKQLNSKQPDVVAATVLTNLSFWQKNKYPSTLIGGRRHSFRSLKQLQSDCPYLTEAAIHKAIKRVETALGDEFHVNRTKDKFHFSIGDETMERLKIEKRTRKQKQDDTKKHHSFLPDDAKKTGSIRSAVLMNNLRHQVNNFRELKQDELGNKYGQLSPGKLVSALGFSADTTARALIKMCQKGHLIPHATDAGYYALPEGFKISKVPISPDAEVHAKAAEIHSTPAEVHFGSAEIHTQPAEVHSTAPSNPTQSTDHQCFASGFLPGCINECVNEGGNECRNECVKDSNTAGRTSPPCGPLNLSEGIKTLMNLAEAKLAKMRSEGSVTKVRAGVHQDDLPYDIIDPYELAYEVVSERERTFGAELEEGIETLKEFFHHEGFKVTTEDEAKFRQLLTENPKITAMDLCELYLKVKYPPLIFTSMKDQVKSHAPGILTKVKTPSQFLKYLPQIIVLLNWDGEEEFESVSIEEPFNDLNYQYLGEAPNSDIVFFNDGSVPSVVIEN